MDKMTHGCAFDNARYVIYAGAVLVGALLAGALLIKWAMTLPSSKG